MEFEQVSKNEVFSVHEDAQTGIPLFRWEDYVTGKTFRMSAREWEEFMLENGVQKYLVDTQEVPAHKEDDKKWLAETWIPELIEEGIRRGGGVYRDSAIAEMDMSRVEDSLSSIHPEYEFRVFKTRGEAYDWIRSEDI